jgi:hypothetical protein
MFKLFIKTKFYFLADPWVLPPVIRANIVPGSNFYLGPSANTRSQVANRLYFL